MTTTPTTPTAPSLPSTATSYADLWKNLLPYVTQDPLIRSFVNLVAAPPPSITPQVLSALSSGTYSLGGTISVTGAMTFQTDPTFAGGANHTLQVGASGSGAGGSLSILSGQGGGSGYGGALSIDAGTGLPGGGALTLGTTNAASISIGQAGVPAAIPAGTKPTTFTIASTATPSIALANGLRQRMVLTANVTGVTMPAGQYDGQLLTLSWVQDGTGSRTLSSWDGANCRLAGGTVTLSTGANKIDQFELMWDASLGTPAWVELSRALNC